MNRDIILIIGVSGQIGIELTSALRLQHGHENVIVADQLFTTPTGGLNPVLTDSDKLRSVVRTFKVTQIYLLEAFLSSENQAAEGWNLNMQSLLSFLDIAREFQLDRVFWPSSIAVFGAHTPKHNCPQDAILEPATIYGISKRAGEYWCNYYFEKYGVDVRSLRYPGLISYGLLPSDCPANYAVNIFHSALEDRTYDCFLNEDTCLPMLYMPDAIRATLELMDAPKEMIRVRTSYNLAGLSFAPCDLAASIRNFIPDFKISYQPDARQAIADTWPASIDDLAARRDWGWKTKYDMRSMTADMLTELSKAKGRSFELPQPEQDYFPDFPIDHCKLT